MRLKAFTYLITISVFVLVLLCGAVYQLFHQQIGDLAFANPDFSSLAIENAQAKEEPVRIILSPHYDDAVLSLGGLLASNPRDATVVTFFAGKPATQVTTLWDRRAGFSNSDQAIAARVVENQNALAPFGVSIVNLDYPDHQYRDDDLKKDSQFIDQQATQIVQLIDDAKKKYPGRSIEVYGPASFGPLVTHRDHHILHEALLRVTRQNSDATVEFFFYEDFPYVREFIKSGRGDLQTFLETKDHLALHPVVVPFTAAQLDQKISAIKAYPSQIEVFGSTDHIDLVHREIDFATHRCPASVKADACEITYKVL